MFANCAPNTLSRMLPEPARGACERAYAGMPLSTSLFTAHFGVNCAPNEFGLDRYGIVRVPDWARSLRDIGTCARMFTDDPGDRMPVYGIANYGAIDSGLSDSGPTLVTVVGLDRFHNWSGLTEQEEKDRCVRWLDAFQAALDKDYPGFGSAVSERMFLNARSMHNFLNPPDGCVYGFAPLPPNADLGRHPALATDTGNRYLSRLLIRRLRRIYGGYELGRTGGVDGVGSLKRELVDVMGLER